jgi:hypothetical protein
MVASKKNGTRAGVKKSPRPPWLFSDPEWDAMKDRCRNLTPQEGVEESAFLSNRYRRMFTAMAQFQVDLDAIVGALSEKKVPFVLTGAYGIAGWTGRPRATHDVDILVRAGRNHTRAVKALKELYPYLETHNVDWVTAFFVPGETESVIDITCPHRDDQVVTLETAIWVKDGPKKYRVPTLEAALANKYGAMLSLGRDLLKRVQDVIDFATMVKQSLQEGRTPIDMDQVEILGEKVWPGGGGKEIVRLVNLAKEGKFADLGALHTKPEKLDRE